MIKVKSLIFIVFYLVVYIDSHAQDVFVSEDKEWTYAMIVGDGYAETVLRYSQLVEGLEVVNGKTYFKISNSEVEKDSDAGLMREEGQKVYFIPQDSTEEILLYDFSLDLGDTIEVNDWLKSLPGYEYLLGDRMIVNEIDSIEGFSGEMLKRIYLKGESFGGLTWIENLGNSYGSLTRPRGYPAYDDHPRPNLMCVQRGEDILYEKIYTASNKNGELIAAYDCDGQIMPNEEDSEVECNDVAFYPNPFTHSLFVESSECLEYIFIYSPNGHLISSIYHPNDMIDLSQLSQGVYYLKFETLEKIEYRCILKY